MVKFGFKIFGFLSVFFFLTIGSTYIAMNTMPPSCAVRDEVRENMYPVARLHLTDKLNRYLDDVKDAKAAAVFTVSEVEINAWIYKVLSEKAVVRGVPVVVDPYLFVRDGSLKFRFDVPFDKAFALILNSAAGLDVDKSIRKIAKSKKKSLRGEKTGSVAFTFVVKAFWVEKEKRPYVYLDRFYIGVFPVPIPVMASDYQDQFNKFLEDAIYETFSFAPVLIRKIEVRDKEIRFLTELKMTDNAVAISKINEFNKKNPELASAIEKRNCLYGCTPGERKQLKKWMKMAGEHSANGVSNSAMAFFRKTNKTMTRRKKVLSDYKLRRFKGTDWKTTIEHFPDRDWKFKNLPPELIGREDLYRGDR